MGDLTGLWVTINEPFVLAYFGYAGSDFPPGARSMPKMVQALRNIALAHAAAYRAIHELQPGALVGLAHQYRGIPACPSGNPLDALLQRLRHSIFNETVPRAAADGRFRIVGANERLAGAAGTQDFFGLNYYTAERSRSTFAGPATFSCAASIRPKPT